MAQGNAEVFENWLGALQGRIGSSGHEIKCAFAGLGDAGCHAGFERLGTNSLRERLDIEVDLRRDGGAVDEKFALRSNRQAVALLGENRPHGLVIGHNRDDNARKFIHAGQRLRSLGSNLGSQVNSEWRVTIEDSGDLVSFIFEAAGHVRAHAADSNECDGFVHKFLIGKEGIGVLLFADGGERTMARADDGGVRKGQNLFAVVAQGIGVGNHPSAHRPRKHGISDHCDGHCQALDKISHPARRVPAGEARFDGQATYVESAPGTE